jgi:hypothetical protein
MPAMLSFCMLDTLGCWTRHFVTYQRLGFDCRIYTSELTTAFNHCIERIAQCAIAMACILIEICWASARTRSCYIVLTSLALGNFFGSLTWNRFFCLFTTFLPFYLPDLAAQAAQAGKRQIFCRTERSSCLANFSREILKYYQQKQKIFLQQLLYANYLTSFPPRRGSNSGLTSEFQWSYPLSHAGSS